jgi:hypothetical protein
MKNLIFVLFALATMCILSADAAAPVRRPLVQINLNRRQPVRVNQFRFRQPVVVQQIRRVNQIRIAPVQQIQVQRISYQPTQQIQVQRVHYVQPQRIVVQREVAQPTYNYSTTQNVEVQQEVADPNCITPTASVRVQRIRTGY